MRTSHNVAEAVLAAAAIGQLLVVFDSCTWKSITSTTSSGNLNKMTAHDQIRAMLDQLMGTGRNGENNRFQVKFSDPKVCKSFLLSCCPHEILSSTVSGCVFDAPVS